MPFLVTNDTRRFSPCIPWHSNHVLAIAFCPSIHPFWTRCKITNWSFSITSDRFQIVPQLQRLYGSTAAITVVVAARIATSTSTAAANCAAAAAVAAAAADAAAAAATVTTNTYYYKNHYSFISTQPELLTLTP